MALGYTGYAIHSAGMLLPRTWREKRDQVWFAQVSENELIWTEIKLPKDGFREIYRLVHRNFTRLEASLDFRYWTYIHPYTKRQIEKHA